MTRYCFSEFELDTNRLEFRANGDLRALEPQVFDVLRHLAENADRLVSREELIDVVWGGRIVSDATVSARINAVRRAVGDSGQTQALIKTIPRRGFRFVGEVSVDESDGNSEPAQVARTAEQTIQPPTDTPSIAVLPFSNMSDDLDQEYFSDGITEDIITALSRLRWLMVIARNSTFTYKGRAVDVKQVGREMGVRYVLEGSVRKAGKRIRVTAEIADAGTGNQIWAERYDRELVDVFDLQDELTEAICAHINVELASTERTQAHKKLTTDLDAWDLYQRGMWHYYKMSKDDMVEARRLLQLANDRASEFANAYAGLALVGFSETMFGYAQDNSTTLEFGLRNAEKALALDDRDGFGHYALGRICTVLGDRDRALTALRKSIDLNPSSAVNFFGLGFALYWFGHAEEASSILTRAIRLSPQDPQLWLFHYVRCFAFSVQDEFDLAITDAIATKQFGSDEFLPYLAEATAYSLSGRIDEARTAYERANRLNPKLSTTYFKQLINNQYPPYVEKTLDALRKAGMPEE